MCPNFVAPESLLMVRDAFREEGFGLRLVGGCVRDTLLGQNPNDVDLHTDATPEEAAKIYERLELRWIPTGIDHDLTEQRDQCITVCRPIILNVI